MSIFGVDFSGAKSGKGTWVASGQITQGKLLITEIVPQTEKDPVGRVEKLAQRIKDSPNSLWALDFPFSLPEQFAKRLMPEPNNSWFTLAQAVKDIELCEFKKKADDCRQENKELLRCTDKQRNGIFSVLHRVRPDMRPMTYYGMRLLVNLVTSQIHVHIPPIIQCSAEKRITILEVHPRSTLSYIFDDRKQWWGYKQGSNNIHLRENILKRLQKNCHLPVEIDMEQQAKLLNSHDALDSLIACWTGGLWLKNPELYDCPQDMPELKLEGWIWTPKPNPFRHSS